MLSSFARNQFNKPMPDPSGARVSLALTRFLHSHADRRVCQNLVQLLTPANYAAREEGDAEYADAT